METRCPHCKRQLVISAAESQASTKATAKQGSHTHTHTTRRVDDMRPATSTTAVIDSRSRGQKKPARWRLGLIWLAVFVLSIIIAELGIMWWWADRHVELSPAVDKIAAEAQPSLAPTITPLAPVVQIAEPAKIRIAKIGLDASIIPVGVTKEGNMDVPKNLTQVGWYNKGPKPGEKGKAVLDGHYGAPNQVGVFRKLDGLKEGDIVEVDDKNGKIWKFAVKRTEAYRPTGAPLNEIFGDAQKPMLNLITCYGDWYASAYKYDKRLIIFTELIDQ